MSLHTPLCDRFDIEVPILQAGMGKAKGSPTSPEMVVAVSEAGGLGCIGAVGLDVDELSTWIRTIKSQTSRPFAVDVLVPDVPPGTEPTRAEIRATIRRDHPAHWAFLEELFTRYGLEPAEQERTSVTGGHLAQQQIEVALDEGVPVLVMALGNAGPVVEAAHARGTKVVAMAGSPRHAQRHAASGVDAIIAQGYEAGGHTGTIATFPLIPAVVDAVRPCPVIGAGGIADGRGVVAALALGAQAAWCGTLFLFAEEANLSDDQRRQLLGASATDVVVSTSYTGKPSRIVRTSLIEDWKSSGLPSLPMPYQHVLMDDFVVAAQRAGRWDLVNNPAGQVTGALHEIRPAAQIVASLVAEAETVLHELAAFGADTPAAPGGGR